MGTKKVLITTVLGIVMITATGVGASATITEYHKNEYTNMDGHDMWTRGLHNGGTGYYLGYSYYRNKKDYTTIYYKAYSRVRDSSTFSASEIGSNGRTTCANSISAPFSDNVKNTAAITDVYGNIKDGRSEIDGANEFSSSDPY